MSSLPWIILMVCFTIVIEGRETNSEAEDFSKLKDKIKRGCRLRPGQIFCPSRREMLPDLFKAMPPPQLAETYAQPKRANPVENEEKRTTKCPDGTRPRPGSLWCPKPGKRDIAAPKLTIEGDNFAKFKEELKRGCRPRPGALWCSGKREVPETDEVTNE